MADEYYLTPPKKQCFYKWVAGLMTFLGLGDQVWWGYRPAVKCFMINRLFIKFLAPIVTISQLVYLWINYHDLTFAVLGAMFSIIPVAILANSVLISSRQTPYKNIMIIFMNEIHVSNYKRRDDFVKSSVLISSRQTPYKNIMIIFMNEIHVSNYKRRDDFVKSIIINVEKYTRWTSYYLFIFLMIDWLAWIICTGLNNYTNFEAIQNKSVRLQTVIYLVVPFDYEYDFSNWIFIHTFNVYIVWSGCILLIVFNAISYAFMYNFIGHLHILKYKIKTESFDNATDEEVKFKLVDIIKYHAFIIRIFKDIQSAFGLNVTSNYLYNLIADSLLLYQIMVGDRGNLLMYGLMFVVYVGGLILLSFVLEEVHRQSDDISTLVYQYLPWEKMSFSNQKIVVLILARMQKPLQFKASGGLRSGVKPMISILKSTFSYYVILKANVKT